VGAKTISDFSNNSLANTASRALAEPLEPPDEPKLAPIWRRRSIIGYSVIAALLIGCLYLLFAPRRYTSFAEIYIVREQAIAGQAPDGAAWDEELNTQAQLMKSTPVLALALAEPGIRDTYTLNGVSDPVDYLQNNVSSEVERGREIVSISFESSNAVQAAEMVNAIAKSYLTYQTRIHHSNSGEILDLLEKQKARDEDEITNTNRQFAALRDMYGQTNFDGTANNPIIQQETALSNALTTARLEEVSAKAQYDQALGLVGNDQNKLKQIELPDNAADMIAASPTQLEQIKAEIFRLGQTMRDLERNYLPDHPVVKQVASRIDELTITYVRAERQRWLSAKSQKEALQASFDQQHKLVVEQASRADEFNRVKGQLDQAEKDLELVESRINQLSTNQDAGGLNIQIIRPGVPSTSPSHPAKTTVVAWYGLAGLIIGCGLALMREKLPLGRGPMSRLSAELGSPIMGVLPAISGAGTLATRAMQTHLEPNGLVAEAARSIARGIAESGLDESNGRTLLIASMNPLEGRTTLTANLALAMAQSGMKVLLVDGNNRSPKLGMIFNLSNPFGLFDVLAGRTNDHPAIHTTNIKNLDVLPCGNTSGNCVEMLNNETLVDVLGELSDRYDRVLVDSPPLARGVEARILAANCAAAILVTAARPTARRQVNQGLRLLRSVGANVLGLVINEPGATDPLSISGTTAATKRSALSVQKREAFHPVLTTGDEE
jgi:capsular exopolysaccharide synthesis family protein